MECKLEDLVGASVTGLWVDPGEEHLRIVLADGRVLVGETDGDCCSETWWADATGVKQLIGGIVSAAKEIPMDDYDVNDGRGRQSDDEAYGVRITTNLGVCDLVFRNSSNGYYGGSVIWYWADDVPSTYRSIDEDWRA